MQKLRALLPGKSSSSSATKNKEDKCNSLTQQIINNVAPEVGFQITIQQQASSVNNNSTDGAFNSNSGGATVVPELNVHLIAARHLPALFGFKVVQGYLIKVKLFPGSKRLDSCIQTNSWPKFNENFKFPLAPDKKSSLKHSANASNRHSFKSSNKNNRIASELTPEELFEGQFVVFTVYALLELPPASFNRFNKTYRSLRDKSSNLVQKVVENTSSVGKVKDEPENANEAQNNKKVKRKPSDANPKDPRPQLTISESRRNIGSVTCYLEPKIFKRNSRGLYATEEMWLEIKDINTTAAKGPNSNLTNAVKGVVELALEVRDLSENATTATILDEASNNDSSHSSPAATPTLPTTPNGSSSTMKNPQWNRMTSEVKRKMGISNISKSQQHDLVLRVTTARMRCTNKVKDELEATAGSVYVKTTVFQHGIYLDSWKSSNFYPSLSTKWDVGDDAATLQIPLPNFDNLQHILIRTTLATKTKMAKKIVLGTVLIGADVPSSSGGAGSSNNSGSEHMRLLCESPFNERVPMWHSYQ